MRFQIHHRTCYRYAGPATESFMEARLQPAETPYQHRLEHRLEINPASNLHTYEDYFGNRVHTFSVVRRHERLELDSYTTVETRPCQKHTAAWTVSVSESRQIYRSERLRHYEFLHASPAISLDAAVNKLANRFFRASSEIGPSVESLNSWIYENFRYQAGATHLGTTVAEVLKSRTGVCQDFAQVMIAILRSAEIPARYVVGYIETDSQRAAAENGAKRHRLIGAAESHAWVEIKLPSGEWWPFDPTNNCEAGERHVKVSVGRDYHDCTPTRGVFKGTHTTGLEVTVNMRRQPPPGKTDSGASVA
jgi:transglutaminase-like putative cysteine protease